MNEFRSVLLAVCLLVMTVPPALAQGPSPELVGMLTKDLNVTPKQATGGAGALFNVAKSRLKPDQFRQIAAVVPGMDGLLKAAPSTGGLSGLGGANVASLLGGALK
jgi:hypothetical protein